MRSLLPEINFDAKEDSSKALEPLQSFGSKSTNIESLWKEKKPSSNHPNNGSYGSKKDPSLGIYRKSYGNAYFVTPKVKVVT